MEALLNLVWLIVALGLIGLWRFRWLASRRDPRAGVLPEIVAISCAISLLLPAISLTDACTSCDGYVVWSAGSRDSFAFLRACRIENRGNYPSN
jgi:hypothetical protein